jgi:CrcB protein
MQLGSFFMGWVGVVFKKDIAMYSEHLAVGLSTGLMGSITTFASMMQRNLAIIVTGRWLTGLFGLLLGRFAHESQMNLQLL